ncbi:MAG: trigger factor [Alphaproteobacteria bacterium]|nr:trigger factor [Alphaproteobacteria bacterium]
MQIEVVAENAYARKVNVTVPAAQVGQALDRAYGTMVQRARLPGFRQGKVPRKVLEARFGPGIAQDVAGDLIQEGWRRAMDDEGIQPVSRPTVTDQGELAAGSDFTFVIAVEVKPQVEVTAYTGLDVVWPEFAVGDAQIEAELDRRRRAEARLAEVTGRAVELGDTVQVEVTAKDGDEVVLSEPGTLVRTRGETWLKGLGAALVGLELDTATELEVSFDADAGDEKVAGRTLATSLKVLSIQAMQAPALDDALAQELGFDDLAAFRASVTDELAAGSEEASRNQARANLLDALIAANPVDVPRGMVDQNLEMLKEELKLQRAYRGIDPRSVQFTDAEIADLRSRAAFAARGALLLEAVCAAESLAVEDAELDTRIEEMAAERGQTAEAVRGWFQRDGALEDLRHRMLEEKALDWLLERAKVTRKAPEEAAAEAAPAAEPEKKSKAKPKSKAKAKAEAEAPAAEEPAVEAAPAPKAKGGGKYKTIAGVRYAKDLLDRAEEAGGPLALGVVQELVAAAQDGKGITDVEKRTLAYVRETHGVTDEAGAWLDAQGVLD